SSANKDVNKAIWLKDFQFFGDKSGAVNPDTGVSNKLCKMLQHWCRPGQKLANLMYSFVPEEKSQLAKEDRLQMSLGLKMDLNRYGFDVKPEMVSDSIIVAACALHDCDYCYKEFSGSLRIAGNLLKDVSHFNCEDWDLLKLATALKLICRPEEKIVVGNPQEMFSADELSKLVNDAPRYKDKLIEYSCSRTYEAVSFCHKLRTEQHKLLGLLVKEAEKACEAGQADDLRSWGLEKPSQDSRSCGQEPLSKKLRSRN
ncbi:hypothetical protein EJB05_19612, partial [Eragrostis curvula]